MQVERIFSGHNLVKSHVRSTMAMKASAAQTRLFRNKDCLGPFGEDKMEAYVQKVAQVS